jgi:3-oxoacyl-[acyl-carrier protein] reductase
MENSLDMEHGEVVAIARAFDLTGKVAVLTGGASGIGRSAAYILAGAGATIVIGDIDEAGAKTVASDLAANGHEAIAVHTDVTDRAQVDALVARAVAEYGRLDIMGNIAGIPSRSLIADLTDEVFEHVMSTHVRSTLYGCQAAIKVMEPQGSGVIINIASGAIDTAAPTLGAYAMSKAAVAMLTMTLATEVAAKGIRVNALAPGMILTRFSRPHFVDEEGEVVPEKLAAFRQMGGAMHPVGRIGHPADVAWTILYLVSDVAEFVTGQILRPNGGTAMRW